jgi:hypothetical protein
MKPIRMMILCFALAALAVASSRAEVLTDTLEDGAKIRVFYDRKILEGAGLSDDYARYVLRAAKDAYTLLTVECGFSTPGFSFACPDKTYTFDPDRTIDIFIGDPGSKERFCGYGGEDFRTAYFDPRPVDGDPNAREAAILFPVNADRLRERAVSTSHADDEGQVIAGTMAHEMSHLVNYYYNKNLKEASGSRGVGWFVEGFARYVETKTGSRDSFYSRGYVRKVPEGYAYLEEGVNYFMASPNRPLDEMAYDYAIFWSYFDERYGMRKIELLSRRLRGIKGGDSYMRDLQGSFEEVTGSPMTDILAGFAYYVYSKSLDPATRDGNIDGVKHSSVVFDGKRFILKNRGDSWYRSVQVYKSEGTNPWAMDVHKVTFSRSETPALNFRNTGSGDVVVQLIDLDGKELAESIICCVVKSGDSLKLFREDGVALEDAGSFYLLVTNLSFCDKAGYEITVQDSGSNILY